MIKYSTIGRSNRVHEVRLYVGEQPAHVLSEAGFRAVLAATPELEDFDTRKIVWTDTGAFDSMPGAVAVGTESAGARGATDTADPSGSPEVSPHPALERVLVGPSIDWERLVKMELPPPLPNLNLAAGLRPSAELSGQILRRI